jgi:histone acetyltransferase (RNA polymerase elongator complex component)
MIIPFFIMNRGCPHRCIFCNPEKTVGPQPAQISAAQFDDRVRSHLGTVRGRPGDVQVAFYGGNFTGLAREEQIRLLECARGFIGEGLVHSVRISTRPDHIDADRLALLKAYGVRTIEIGAQSMVDGILGAAGRGHSAADVERAVGLIRQGGFEAGVHLMAGLPGEKREHFEYSVEQVIRLQPHMIRIHPTIVFADTPLADLYRNEGYEPLRLAEAVDLCKFALRRFGEAGIPVIRVGLQSTAEMEKAGSILAGPYHPAFRSLVDSSLFLDMAASLLSTRAVSDRIVVLSSAPCDESRLRGLKNENLLSLKMRFGLRGLAIASDPEQEKGTLRMAVRG